MISLPTHKELLDHYSWKLMNDYQWSMKKLIKETSDEFNVTTGFKDKGRNKGDLSFQQGPGDRVYACQQKDMSNYNLCISG